MGRLTKITAAVCASIVLSGILGFIGYKYFISNSRLDSYTHRLNAAGQSGGMNDDTQMGFAHQSQRYLEQSQHYLEPVPVFAGDTPFLESGAKIIYRYHYLKDGHIETSSENAPYFFIGLTRMELAEKLMGWELVEFSPQLIVFEKRVNARSTDRYTVGILNGHVTVFYDEEVDGSRVKEQTEIPVDALSEDEISRLMTGIRVIGEEQLLKVLEDYGS